eukprot:CAMPEP_0196658622 /NCGR_PEP_ID=MMETSP1086-20130531/30606_1 /TAXON_ID=77921 /ORGANISM="Cyanoptyche  gloeocystis , Strain SAG4.97" /LENGTH=151 /DNA_ID=CAMNT_0041992265 /DNA_START=147 /DNA_END=604 /DNA_ORIENTATION=+
MGIDRPIVGLEGTSAEETGEEASGLDEGRHRSRQGHVQRPRGTDDGPGRGPHGSAQGQGHIRGCRAGVTAGSTGGVLGRRGVQGAEPEMAASLAMSSDPSVPDEDKPEVYKNPDKAWGGSGNRNPLLSSFNFLSELKLAVSSTGPSKSPEP